MSSIHSRKLRHIPTEITVPGDKSISHRSVMFAGLCEGSMIIENFLPSEDCRCSLHAMEALGAQFEILEDSGNALKIRVTGKGMYLQAPTKPIDCGNSGTTMRLLSGILAGQPFETTLTGDPSLSSRPMKRIADPLNIMGATVTGVGEKICAPLTIQGGKLRPMTYELPMASAQVKSAILLAGLQATGKTTVIEPVPTRNHTELLLAHFDIKTQRDGNHISIYGGSSIRPHPLDLYVPGDISSAAFWMVVAAATPGSQLTIRNVGLNPTRAGIISVLVRMGAQIEEFVEVSHGEPMGNIVIKGTELNATAIGGAEIANVIDELPILAVAAALARGKTIIKNAQELRVKETDRISAVAKNLQLMGGLVQEYEDGMEIQGGAPLKGTRLQSSGDHRIAMAFAIAGLFAEGATEIENTDCIATSYPGFADHLALFLNEPRYPDHPTPVISRLPSSLGERLSHESNAQ